MASASTCGEEAEEASKPDATSEWIVANTGHSRSQIMDLTMTQLVSSLCDILSYYNSHPEYSPSSELLLEVQELCIPIASYVETFPLIEAVLQHCCQERWEFPTHSGSITAVSVCPLSPQFLQTVSQLYSSGSSNMSLSYKSQLVLWKAYPPALHQEVQDMTEACMVCSENSISAILTAHRLPRACAEDSELYRASEAFLSELAERESIVLHVFNETVSNIRAQAQVDARGGLLSHISCLQTKQNKTKL